MGGRQRTSLFMGIGESGGSKEAEKTESGGKKRAQKGRK